MLLLSMKVQSKLARSRTCVRQMSPTGQSLFAEYGSNTYHSHDFILKNLVAYRPDMPT